ncbi:MAG: ribose-5-phosphate isomerase RpiA [Bauldia sp.]|nr:ribose-5-phosphate isomerase RpiA [Bauldia sp.]
MEALKRRAAAAALDSIQSGMIVGLGTGSTADQFIRLLAEKARAGLKVRTVSSSERSTTLARAEGLDVATLDELPQLDVTVDGADEVDQQLRLIKGGGGALLREKIVATASRRMIVICDEGKLVAELGRFPLPIEVVPFGVTAIRASLDKAAARLGLGGAMAVRQTATGEPYYTDGGHLIIDASFGRIPDPEALADALDRIPGVVLHGLFIGLASEVILAGADGVRRLTPPQPA